MLFKHLKEQMLLPNDKFIINKTVTIRDKECMILGMTSENEENKLWIIMHEENYGYRADLDEDCCDDYEEAECEKAILINRERMENDISNDRCHLNIKEIEIQGQKVNFNSSTGTCLCDNNYDLWMALQYFVENGVSIDSFDEYNTCDLILYTYNQQEGEEFPKIDMSKELNIKIVTSPDYEQILINKPITVSFEDKINEKLSFYDEETNRDYYFYINKVEINDVWDEARKHFESDRMKKAIEDSELSDEQLQEMKNNYYEALENMCPKNMHLAMIEYEAEDDIQLNFYAKEFLDTEVKRNKGACAIFMFSSDSKIGSHGLKNRVCMLKPIEKDFKGAIYIELFSWYKKIPEAIILI